MKKNLLAVVVTVAVMSALAWAESRTVMQGKDSSLVLRDLSVSSTGIVNVTSATLALEASQLTGTHKTQVTDSAGVAAKVLAASTAVATTDTALVVAVSPNATVLTNPAAQTSGTWTEVLVLTSSTSVPTTPLSGRRAIEIQNNGPNETWCRAGGGTPTVGVGRRLAPKGATTPSDSWAFDASDTVVVKCIAATANQVTTAATSVQELK